MTQSSNEREVKSTSRVAISVRAYYDGLLKEERQLFDLGVPGSVFGPETYAERHSQSHVADVRPESGVCHKTTTKRWRQ
jgi:hypothetical protein